MYFNWIGIVVRMDRFDLNPLGGRERTGKIVNKYLSLLFGLGSAMLFASAALAYSGSYVPGAGINASPHDLSRSDTGMNYKANPPDALNRICIFCHAPHNTYRLSTTTGGGGARADAAFDYLPLWNHGLQEDTAYVMYEDGGGQPVYGGAKPTQAIKYGMTAGSTSLLCLSCHDGTVAPNAYGNSDGQLLKSVSGGGGVIVDSYDIGKGKYLGNHHPIGFNYDLVQGDDVNIEDADVARLTPTAVVRNYLSADGTMECGTCHSVHNKGNSGEQLLWKTGESKQLCEACHLHGIYTAP